MSEAGSRHRDREAPVLIHHRHVAARLGLRVEQFRRFVRRGLVPPPLSEIGSLWFYRVADVEHFENTGAWPQRVHRAGSSS